jgi:hypothetical protein
MRPPDPVARLLLVCIVFVGLALLSGCGTPPPDPRGLIEVPSDWRTYGGTVGSPGPTGFLGALGEAGGTTRLRYGTPVEPAGRIVGMLAAHGTPGRVEVQDEDLRAWCATDGEVAITVTARAPDGPLALREIVITATADPDCPPPLLSG